MDPAREADGLARVRGAQVVAGVGAVRIGHEGGMDGLKDAKRI
jgi:hypothetical protein